MSHAPANDTSALDLRDSLRMSLDILARDIDPQLRRIREQTLADQIAHLLNAHEPCLRAEADGALVEVHDKGSGAVLLVTISEIVR